MAALDFNMAKNRGFFAGASEATLQALQKTTTGLQPEAYWNKAFDNIIKEGYKETSRVPKSTFAGRGSFQTKVNQKGYESATPIYGPVTYNQRGGRKLVRNEIVAYDAVKQVNLSSGELNAITREAQASTAKAKKELQRQKYMTSSRKARGAGGLVAKAVAPGMGPEATKLPALGEQGLGLVSNMLGEELKI